MLESSDDRIGGNPPQNQPPYPTAHDTCGSHAVGRAETALSNAEKRVEEQPGPITIPNDFIRALDQFASFLTTQGRDADERLAHLRRNCNSMSPMARESAAQLLDFVLSVLTPLGDIVPPIRRRKRATPV